MLCDIAIKRSSASYHSRSSMCKAQPYVDHYHPTQPVYICVCIRILLSQPLCSRRLRVKIPVHLEFPAKQIRRKPVSLFNTVLPTTSSSSMPLVLAQYYLFPPHAPHITPPHHTSLLPRLLLLHLCKPRKLPLTPLILLLLVQHCPLHIPLVSLRIPALRACEIRFPGLGR
jgi:hypothetical protein